MHYWTNIPKNRSTYHASRGVKEDEIAKILQAELVINKDLNSAEQKLLATDGIRRFSNGLKTEREKDDFRRHLRRYAQIYLPDCPFEVNSTNRYTIVSHEAAVTARRFIRRNESVKYLSGIQVTMTPEEEKEIAFRKKDFSVVVSSRNKCTSLFMGPARFANHDCNANAKLMTTSHAGIEIIAVRNIDVGEEITVTYGDNYFGEDNCECLCNTCETLQRNGWEPEDGPVAVRTSIEDDNKTETYSLRRRRRDDSVGGASSRTSSVAPILRPKVYKTRRTKSSRLSLARDSTAVESPAPDATTPDGKSKKRSLPDGLASPPITPAKKLKLTADVSLEAPPSSRSSSTSRSGSSGGDGADTDLTSPEKESPEPLMPTPTKDSTSIEVKPANPMSLRSILNEPDMAKHNPVAPITASIEMAEETGSEVQVREDEDADAKTAEAAAPAKRRKYQKRVFVKQTTPPAESRTPGDYVLTPLLLSEPAMAWVQCSNCPTYFVQQNAYCTRSACPRCERHSILYGYKWPKTDKAGPHDREERILDHRTVHRFLDSNDERIARGRKPLREDSRDDSEEAEAQEPPPKRGRPKSRTALAPTKTKGNAKSTPAPKTTPAAAKASPADKTIHVSRKDETPTKDDDDAAPRRSSRSRRMSARMAAC